MLPYSGAISLSYQYFKMYHLSLMRRERPMCSAFPVDADVFFAFFISLLIFTSELLKVIVECTLSRTSCLINGPSLQSYVVRMFLRECLHFAVFFMYTQRTCGV